jgi:nitrate reductase gamma subunit
MNDLSLVLFCEDAFSVSTSMTVVVKLLNLMVKQKYLSPQTILFMATLLITLLLTAPKLVTILPIFRELLTKVSADEIIALIYVKICGVELQSKE